MKVLYIIDSLNGSGAERSIVQIALKLEDIVPVFVHLFKGEMLKTLLESNGVKVYSLDLPKKNSFENSRKQLINIYIKEQPDIVHSTLFRSDMVARSLKNEFPEIKLVGSFVSNPYKEDRYKGKNILMRFKLWRAYLRDKISIKNVDHIVSNSETIKTAQCRKLDVPLNKVSVIYRGRENTTFINVSREQVKRISKDLGIENKIVLLNVSRLIPEKGQMDIIKSLPVLLNEIPDIIVLFAGHGVYQKELLKTAEELKVEKYVKFLGRRTDIPELLGLADLFIYPSYSEGLPGALIEAMMAEKIIISSNILENLECVDDETAIIFKKGNVNELSAKTLFALKNKKEFELMRHKARKKAITKFDINRIGVDYSNLYKDLIRNNWDKPQK